MATALANLIAAFTTEIATIKDDLLKKKALYVLEGYETALTKQAALEASEIESYTIAGRTVTRRRPEVGREVIAGIEGELNQLLYGSVTLLDMNANAASVS